ncbi:uncharacterized protein [Atheta coriaria]|uniref:uncharacterized protein isoform X2 n=1 Tax=Dalotia coriaria TaxID=877792 RepID=UPI0031F3AB37
MIQHNFNDAYEPTRLGNWEVPKWYPPGPLPRQGKTTVISNPVGHLLPGFPRTKNSWGQYLETWDMPKVITRKIAKELSAPAQCRVDVYNKRLKNFESSQNRRRKIPEIPSTFNETKPEETKVTENVHQIKRCPCLGDCTCLHKRTPVTQNTHDEEDVEEHQLKPFQAEQDPERCKEEKYVPGDLTEDHHKLDTFPQLEKDLTTQTTLKTHPEQIDPLETLNNPPEEMKQNEELTPFQQKISNHENNTPHPEEVITHKMHETTDFVAENEQTNPTQLDDGIRGSKMNVSRCSSSKSSKNTTNYCYQHEMYKKHPRELKSYVETLRNFELARELHKVNLEHEPLPDMVPKEFFVQLDKRQVPPIREKSATAIGWKGYKGFGATRCTKLKVFRPTTSPEMRKFEERQDSICSFDKKWRFIKQNKVNPMDLAICWDLTPENPADEPRKAKHIDGSNGSIAPGVFSMVETPKNKDLNERNEPVSGRNPPAVFAAISQPTEISKIGDFHVSRPHTSKSTTNLNHTCCEGHSDEFLKRAQSAYHINANNDYKKPKKRGSKDSKSTSSNICQKLCCSGKIFNQRLCVACELKSLPEKEEKGKPEFKQALKAGVPNSKSSSGSTHSSQAQIKVPKQKIPYTKKCYAIRSLSAPFSLNKVRDREDYPEHWRLASVYQHSYKPIHMRKKSLLASIFQ